MEINYNFILESIKEIKEVTKNMEGYIPFVNELAENIYEFSKKTNFIYAIGNGGSFSDSDHLCGELLGRFEKEKRGLPINSLGSLATITSIANDYGYEYIYSKQLETLLKPKDLLIVFSTSGKSKNILNAVKVAIKKKCRIYALTGHSGLELKNKLITECRINSKRTCRIQEMHGILIHLICEIIDNKLLLQ